MLIGLRVITLGPDVQSPICSNPGLSINETLRVNAGLTLVWT